MATINGSFDFTGSFGNMRCYWDSGTKKWIFGKKGGFDKKQFDTLDTLKPQRENASDFSGRIKWGSLLYASLEFVTDKLGKPISCHEFILLKKLYEYQYKLLTYYHDPDGKNILINELSWELKNGKIIVWFYKVGDKWKSIDNLSWDPNLIKY